MSSGSILFGSFLWQTAYDPLIRFIAGSNTHTTPTPSSFQTDGLRKLSEILQILAKTWRCTQSRQVMKPWIKLNHESQFGQGRLLVVCMDRLICFFEILWTLNNATVHASLILQFLKHKDNKVTITQSYKHKVKVSCEIQPACHNYKQTNQQGTKWAGKAYMCPKKHILGQKWPFFGQTS